MTTPPSHTDFAETGLTEADLDHFRDLVETHETWLAHHVVDYAIRHGYSSYMPPLHEVWFKSIAGLSTSLLLMMETDPLNRRSGPDHDYATDPVTWFVVDTARAHSERGISLGFFMSLVKYHRQTYLDLVDQKFSDALRRDRFSQMVRNFFDRIEIALCMSWKAAKNQEENQHLLNLNRVIIHQKNKYFSIFESLQSPVALLDRNSRLDTVNHAWSIMFGGTTIPGAHHSAHPDIHESIAWLAAELDAFFLSDSLEERLEKQVKTIMGIRYLSVRLQRMADITENIGGCMIILDDITEQKETESALQEVTLWLHEIFNSLEDAVFTVSPDGLLVSTNRAAERIFGYTQEEVRGRTSEMFHVDPESYNAFTTQIYRAIEEGRHASFEYTGKRKNGDVFPAWIHVRRLEKPDGGPLGIVGVVRDISELKAAEEIRLESERFQGALELAGAVCHDLNQPLMAIAGYAELLLMDFAEEAPQAVRLKKIMGQVTKMGEITRRLMSVTRYETKAYLDQKILDIEKSSTHREMDNYTAKRQ